MSTRTYRLKRRAERQEETRQRIVEAAVELHSTVGPARATVAAIADRAGVTRPTVYAHFPDAEALFRACSGHVRATVPPPDPAPWREIEDPDERLETALGELYGYYARLEPLLENIQRDAPVMPVVREMNRYRVQYLADVRELLLAGRRESGDAETRVRRALGHALEFGTWQSLVRGQGCSAEEAVELMVAFVGAAAAERRLGARTASAPARSRVVNRRDELLAAARTHGVSNIRLFGSVARDESRADSDVDLLVDLDPGRSLVDLAAFREEAERVLGTSVDVASADLLKPLIRDAVLRDAEPL